MLITPVLPPSGTTTSALSTRTSPEMPITPSEGEYGLVLVALKPAAQPDTASIRAALKTTAADALRAVARLTATASPF